MQLIWSGSTRDGKDASSPVHEPFQDQPIRSNSPKLLRVDETLQNVADREPGIGPPLRGVCSGLPVGRQMGGTWAQATSRWRLGRWRKLAIGEWIAETLPWRQAAQGKGERQAPTGDEPSVGVLNEGLSSGTHLCKLRLRRSMGCRFGSQGRCRLTAANERGRRQLSIVIENFRRRHFH